MDVQLKLYVTDKVIVDQYTGERCVVTSSVARHDNVIDAIHLVFRQLEQVAHDKFGRNAVMHHKCVFVNVAMLRLISGSELFDFVSSDDVMHVGELFGVCSVNLMLTLSDVRVQACASVNLGGLFDYTLFGLVDIV